MTALFVTIAVLLIGSALCSGSEVAILSVNEARIRTRAEAGERAAERLLQIRQHITRPIATIVVLNNVFNIVGSIVVGTLAAETFGSGAVGIVSGVLTFLVIVFAEIVPKALGERYAEPVALAIAGPIRTLTVLFTPVVVGLELLTRPLTRGDRGPSTDEAEIRILARIGRSEGVIEEDEAEMLSAVFQLNDVLARDLMTPRTAVTWLDVDLPLADARDAVLASEHSRIVVARAHLDDVVGVALRHDLLAALLTDDGSTVGDHLREVGAVPWFARADDLLRRFRAERRHLVLVIDEFGGTMGVVTLEDVVEVLTGPILDETDRRADLRRFARERAQRRQRARRGR